MPARMILFTCLSVCLSVQTLEGHLRAILGTLTVEDIYKDREKFANLVRETAKPDLAKMGTPAWLVLSRSSCSRVCVCVCLCVCVSVCVSVFVSVFERHFFSLFLSHAAARVCPPPLYFFVLLCACQPTGLDILSFTIQDVYDSLEYLDSLGKAQTAAVMRDAEIGRAEAERDSGIAVRMPLLATWGQAVCVCVCVCVSVWVCVGVCVCVWVGVGVCVVGA